LETSENDSCRLVIDAAHQRDRIEEGGGLAVVDLVAQLEREQGLQAQKYWNILLINNFCIL
jgi:hypothetical protein